jgi:hypothetical protein
MPEGELQADVRLAIALARDAMEQDASEARARGWGKGGPDSTSVATLAPDFSSRTRLQPLRRSASRRRGPAMERMRRGRPPD